MIVSMAKPSAFETWDAESLGTAVPANDAGPSRSPEFEAVEYGSGWYHDDAIAESEPAPVQKH